MPGAIGDANGVDLNTANQQQLEQVGGLGPDRAKRIIQSRPLKSWEDVKKIEGFSDKLVEDLRQAGSAEVAVRRPHSSAKARESNTTSGGRHSSAYLS